MRKPNVILILADDMGYGDFGCFNYGASETPHLDALMSTGILLNQHYSASPVCAPARAALLTGRYPQRTGVIDTMTVSGMDRMALKETTLSQIFQEAGYRTGLVGKWHGGGGGKYHPNCRGFDTFAGFNNSPGGYFDWTLDFNRTAVKSDGRYLTDVFTEEAIQFIRREQKAPFFLHLAHFAPHGPLEAPQEEKAVFAGRGNLNDNVATIYAMIRRLDAGVGRVLEEVRRLGLESHTIVLFSSDNGPQFASGTRETRYDRFNCGFKGSKGDVHEGGIRVPMLVRWPDGLPGGKVVSHMVHFNDWFPTLCAIAGIEVPRDLRLDGQDVLPVLRGEKGRIDPVRFWQWSRLRPVPTINAAMRDGEWKLVYPGAMYANEYLREDVENSAQMCGAIEEYAESYVEAKGVHVGRVGFSLVRLQEPELYNLVSDPLEQSDLAQKHSQRVERMRRELRKWFDEVDAELCSIDEPGKAPILPP